MDLKTLKIPENKIKQLQKGHIEKIEDLIYRFPKSYQNFSKVTGAVPDQTCVIRFDAKKVRYYSGKTSRVIVYGKDMTTGKDLSVIFFNQSWRYEQIYYELPCCYMVAGTVAISSWSGELELVSPLAFEQSDSGSLGIKPVYQTISGMAASYYEDCVAKAFTLIDVPDEVLTPDLVKQNNLRMSHKDMVQQLHYPQSMELLQTAQNRYLVEEMAYFAMRQELNVYGVAKNSPFTIRSNFIVKDILTKLPYELTPDQKSTIDTITEMIQSGRRVNALIQGDVGCGKTIITFLLMILMAENGYQAALMAPTQLLAKQHYDDLRKLVEPYGIPVALVAGKKMKKAEQKMLEEGLASGQYPLIVGTQALLSESYSFHALAAVFEDEEHKYGVMQRKALVEKAKAGTHTITLSATPIPRSLAQTIYGDHLRLFSIHTMPKGRSPVITGIQNDMNRILSFIRYEANQGHQTYVVCPMISQSDKMEGVASAEQYYETYRNVLEPQGIPVGLVTGKTPKQEAAEIMDRFNSGELAVLVSTTLIEVGVNNRKATVMVIHNAERFGLASLHQLRGRVGRGDTQSWCILSTKEPENPRMKTMCHYTDGFHIAEMDLKLRGAGNFLGCQQSGVEKYLALSLIHTDIYSSVQKCVREMLENGSTCGMLQQAEIDRSLNIGGEMIAT